MLRTRAATQHTMTLWARAMTAMPRRELRSTRKLGSTHMRSVLRRHGLRSGYGGRHRSIGPFLRLRLPHPLLVLRGGPGRCGELGPQILILPKQPGQLRLDLVEKGVDF